MQRPSLLYATQYHAGHLADLALWIILHHLLHAVYTTIGITVVEHAQTLDEQELRTVFTQWETAFRQLGVTPYFLMAVYFESLIGGGIQRVFNVLAELLVLSIVGVGEQDECLKSGDLLG